MEDIDHVVESDSAIAQSDAAAGVSAPKIQTINVTCVVVAIVLVITAIAVSLRLLDSVARSEAINSRYNECTNAATELMMASDDLTMQSRMYVVTGDRRYLDAYLEEIHEVKRRDEAVATLNREADDSRAAAELVEALSESNALAVDELYAMRLTADAMRLDPMPPALEGIDISPEDAAVGNAVKRSRANEMLLGETYRQKKDLIERDVNDCASELIKGLELKVLSIEGSVDRSLFALIVVAILLMSLVVFAAITNYILVARPMRAHAVNIENHQPLTPIGCFEIQRVVGPYNRMYDEVRQRTINLQHEAETDALTGVLNRGSYDKLLEKNSENIALVLADIDYFKQINDEYGHTIGDEVLKKVASAIKNHFRSSDHVCRIGGDEFAVIVTKVTPETRDVITSKLEAITKEVTEAPDDLPKITLSYGVAFSDADNPGHNLYHDADKALYDSKHKGRNASTFYGEG